jgi:hypothetical protein
MPVIICKMDTRDKTSVDWRDFLRPIRGLGVAVRLRGPTSDRVEHGSACGIQGSREVRNFKFSELAHYDMTGLLERRANQYPSLGSPSRALSRASLSPPLARRKSTPDNIKPKPLDGLARHFVLTIPAVPSLVASVLPPAPSPCTSSAISPVSTATLSASSPSWTPTTTTPLPPRTT